MVIAPVYRCTFNRTSTDTAALVLRPFRPSPTTLFRFPYRQGSVGWRYSKEKVGSWTLEEPVHFFDALMWYFERWGDPASVLAVGSSKDREHGMDDNFSALVKWPGQLYAMVTQTLGGFEHHQVMEIVGREGSIRTWWS